MTSTMTGLDALHKLRSEIMTSAISGSQTSSGSEHDDCMREIARADAELV